MENLESLFVYSYICIIFMFPHYCRICLFFLYGNLLSPLALVFTILLTQTVHHARGCRYNFVLHGGLDARQFLLSNLICILRVPLSSQRANSMSEIREKGKVRRKTSMEGSNVIILEKMWRSQKHLQ